MISNSDLPRAIRGIEDAEIKAVAIKSYRKVQDTSSKSSLLTLVSLLRFASYGLSDYSIPDCREKDPFDSNSEGMRDTLQDVVHNSGVYFFGPMFKGSSEFAPLRDKEDMLSCLASAGFDTDHLCELSSTQLDMFFTRVLESGLVTNSHEVVPD